MNLRRFAILSITAATGISSAGAAQWQQPWQQNPNTVQSQNLAFAQQQAMMQQRAAMPQQQQQWLPQQQMNQRFMNPGQVAMMPQAAQPTRITGPLPTVGSQGANVAGRQYLQPHQFDRLAESGLYIGLSLAYTYMAYGGIKSEYNDWFVPGSGQAGSFEMDGSVLPLQISVGAALNTDVRVDFSYTRYSGFNYPSIARAPDQSGNFMDLQTYDGAITSNITMLNVYYNIDSYMGNLVGGALRPYVGIGLGIAVNTISDYIIYDPEYYYELEDLNTGPGILSGVSDIYAYHSGGTTEQLAYMIEGGLTSTMESGMRVDFFVRYMNMGTVSSSGSVVVSQTEWLTDGYGGEIEADYSSVFHFTDYKESGNLSSIDVGVRLRVQF
ncbi:MAG: hypothetical protein LBH81_03355 [Rickettsiales bacterium]|jgi:hypothetical protein|nr:hypothetical protein [Rickettsiales bacterium]